MSRLSNKAVKNISISDAKNGHIIFQRVYSWRPTSAFSNLGLLIQGFYQFAKTFDEGGIDFESIPKDQIRKRREDTLRDHKGETMQMQTVKTKSIIVSVFYDLSGSVMPSLEDQWCHQILLHSVRMAFEIKYLSTLQKLQFDVGKTTIGDFHSNQFDDFTDIADYLCEAIYGSKSSILNSISSVVRQSPQSTMNYNDQESFIRNEIQHLLANLNIDTTKLPPDISQSFDGIYTIVSRQDNSASNQEPFPMDEVSNLNLKVDFVESAL